MVRTLCPLLLQMEDAYEATVKGFDENEDLAVVSVATKDVSNDTMDAISVAKIRKF